jgi:threonine dehydrogenase-like Zn-dependent dehydrogenase
MSASEFTIRFPAERSAELIACEREKTPLRPNEIEGKTLYSLISPGTELNVYCGHYVRNNLSWGRFPFTPGYAAVCEVERTGAAVTDIAPGDRVFCIGFHRTFQRIDRDQCIPIPARLDPAHAPFARIMNITMTTLILTSAHPPDRVLVTGLGPVGLLGALIFQRCGYRVCACDPVGQRRDIARAAGVRDVHETVPLANPAIAGSIGLHLECSGHEQAILDGTQVVRKKGEIVLVGVPMVRRTELYAQELLHRIFRNWITLRSGNEWQAPKHPNGPGEPSLFDNMSVALQWLADTSVPVAGLYHLISPTEPGKVYERALHGQYEKPALVLDWSLVRS